MPLRRGGRGYSRIYSYTIKDLVIYQEKGFSIAAAFDGAETVEEFRQVIAVMMRPTPNRPGLDRFEKNYFNAEIVEVFGTCIAA